MPFCCLARLIIVTGLGRRNTAPQVRLLRRVEGGLHFVGTNGEEGIQDGEKEKNNRWRKQTRPSTTWFELQTFPQRATSVRPPAVRLLQRQAQQLLTTKKLPRSTTQTSGVPPQEIQSYQQWLSFGAVYKLLSVARPGSSSRCVLRPPLGRVHTVVSHLQRNVHLRDAHGDIRARLGTHSRNLRISRKLLQSNGETKPDCKTERYSNCSISESSPSPVWSISQWIPRYWPKSHTASVWKISRRLRGFWVSLQGGLEHGILLDQDWEWRLLLLIQGQWHHERN